MEQCCEVRSFRASEELRRIRKNGSFCSLLRMEAPSLVWLQSQPDGDSFFLDRCFLDSCYAPGTVPGSVDPESKRLETRWGVSASSPDSLYVGVPCAQDTVSCSLNSQPVPASGPLYMLAFICPEDWFLVSFHDQLLFLL